LAKILIVDSDEAAAKQARDALERAGHACVVHHRGDTGLQVAENEDFDLLLLDTMLPKVSGFEICRKIRRQSALFHVPIVFCSAMGHEEEVQHGLKQGADDYITKPFDAADLVQRVERFLQTAGNAEAVDPLTELANAEGSRRRVQALVTRGERFALVYVELLGVRRLLKEAGATARDKAIRHMARAIAVCGEEYDAAMFYAAHMGGGFFVCIVPCNAVETFSKTLSRTWRKHVPRLFESLGLKEAPPEGPSDFMDAMICGTSSPCEDNVSAKDLMDTLTRIRRSVREPVGGVYIDRRMQAPDRA